MKNLFFCLAIVLLATATKAQTADHRWNVGLHGGFSQYNGELGNGFYKFNNAFYGHAGISVNRYLTPHWDASLFATRGELGYLGDWNPDPLVMNHFLLKLTTINLLAKYNFRSPDAVIRPYVFGGIGALLQSGVGDSYVKTNAVDFTLPSLGAGINFRIGEYVNIQFQEMLFHTSEDDVDFVEGGMNDLYLFHTLGVTFNLGKLGKWSDERAGVGDRIDKCPDIKGRKAKTTKGEEQSLRKAKKEKRKAIRSGKKNKVKT